MPDNKALPLVMLCDFPFDISTPVSNRFELLIGQCLALEAARQMTLAQCTTNYQINKTSPMKCQ
jgi:hypothetical protein